MKCWYIGTCFTILGRSASLLENIFLKNKIVLESGALGVSHKLWDGCDDATDKEDRW